VNTPLQVAKGFDDILNSRLYSVRVGNVDSVVFRLIRRDVFGEVVTLLSIDNVKESDRSPLSGKELGGSSADTAGTTGNDLNMSQLSHQRQTD